MKNLVGTIVVAVGALLGVLGIFLPFVSIDILGQSESTNVFTPLTIVWIVAAVAALVFAVLGNKIVTLICAIVAGAGFLISFFVNNGELSDLGSLVNKGIGYWFLLIGGIVMIISGIVYFITSPKTTDSSETTVQ